MRELVFEGPGRLAWREAPEPILEGDGDALVRPVAVALCDADTAALQDEFLPASAVGEPFGFGHEFVAEVVAAGDGVVGFRPGQLVILPVQISCGACDRCRRGDTAHCRTVAQPAGWGFGPFGGNWPGAFADLVRIPYAEHMMVPLPAGVDHRAVVSAGDNLPDAWRTVAPHLRDAPGAEVLVVGRRSIGLYAVAIARACGASRVDYLDTDAERLALAERLGARVVDRPLGERVGSYPITVDASFTSEGLLSALQSLGPGGVCTSVFPGFTDTVLPLFRMWQVGVRLHVGVASCRAHMPDVERDSARAVQLRRIAPGYR